MQILITGGAGFIGSSFIRYLLSEYDELQLVNFDKLTYAGNLENLTDVESNPRYSFVKGDISSCADVNRLFAEHDFDTVVNFAAESHVDRSIHFGSRIFIETNVIGTQNLLDAAAEHKVRRYVQISTDEVYGTLGDHGQFTESSPLRPNNPYAATKAGADCLVRAAGKTHGMNVVTTRCSNNFGPYQFPEKLIPLMIANALADKPLPVYGDGLHVRDWIYVVDHCRAIDLVMSKGEPGQVYNIGGLQDIPNLEVVKSILAALGKPETLITYVEDRPGHDRRYAIDSSRIANELGWQPQREFTEALSETVQWYVDNQAWRERVTSGAYRDYYDAMYQAR